MTTSPTSHCELLSARVPRNVGRAADPELLRVELKQGGCLQTGLAVGLYNQRGVMGYVRWIPVIIDSANLQSSAGLELNSPFANVFSLPERTHQAEHLNLAESPCCTQIAVIYDGGGVGGYLVATTEHL